MITEMQVSFSDSTAQAYSVDPDQIPARTVRSEHTLFAILSSCFENIILSLICIVTTCLQVSEIIWNSRVEPYGTKRDIFTLVIKVFWPKSDTIYNSWFLPWKIHKQNMAEYIFPPEICTFGRKYFCIL